MSTIKISQLPSATTPLAGSEEVPLVQSGVTKKVAVAAFSDYVNVKAYGAVGDGFTDDTAAIQAAQATGKTVFFPEPASFYNVTTPITIGVPIIAGLYRIFGGAGTITFDQGTVTEVYPEWWGIDGTNDHLEINKALAAFSVVALTQKYTIGSSGSLIVMNANNKLIGSQGAEIFSAATPNNTANVYLIELPLGADNCEISGINFRGNGSTAAGTSYPSCISVYKANYANIHDNTFDGISWGVFVRSDSAASANPIGTRIVNNIFYDMTGPVVDKGGYGVLLTFNDGTLVSGNTFEGTSRHCIYLSAATRNAVVSNNICRNAELAPISVFSGTTAGNEIYNCVVSDNRFLCRGTALANSHGIAIGGEVTNCIFDSNLVTGAGEYGLFIQAASATKYPKRLKFTNNVVTASQLWGIYCVDALNCTFIGNTIYNNNLDGGIYETLFGESVTSAAGGHLISDNDILIGQASVRYSIYIDPNCPDVEVYNNKLTVGDLGILEDASGTARVGMFNPGIQSVTYAASVTLDPTAGEVVNITLTGDITIDVDAVKKCKGQKLTIRILQDSTGGWNVTWSSAFENNWSNTGNTSGKLQAISFVCEDGVVFVQTGAATGYYTP